MKTKYVVFLLYTRIYDMNVSLYLFLELQTTIF